MNRDLMITIVGIVLENEWSYDPCETSKMAERALDAILPQVTTVEELEELPVGSKMIDGIGRIWWVSWRDSWGKRTWLRNDSDTLDHPADILDQGPLTVVWTP